MVLRRREKKGKSLSESLNALGKLAAQEQRNLRQEIEEHVDLIVRGSFGIDGVTTYRDMLVRQLQIAEADIAEAELSEFSLLPAEQNVISEMRAHASFISTQIARLNTRIESLKGFRLA